jgi:hypothetical protein
MRFEDHTTVKHVRSGNKPHVVLKVVLKDIDSFPRSEDMTMNEHILPIGYTIRRTHNDEWQIIL